MAQRFLRGGKLLRPFNAVGVALSLAGVVTGHSAESASPPNIVLIMADDMGYTDIGCYGSEIATPTLDRLAADGLRFTQFYNTSRCCPTRAALLTGLYSHQAGVGLMTEDKGYDGYRGDLSRRAVTIAEVLKTAGYRTYMSGKWHVTKHSQPDGDSSNWPRQRGFDRFYGTIVGAGSFYDPTTLCRENTFITPANDPVYRPERFHYTDAISDNAVTFLADHARDRSGTPFFLYVAYTSAHWPMHAPEEDIARYRGKYNAGYQAIREARYQKAKELGVIEADWEMSPPAKTWEQTPQTAWELRCMEVYAAMTQQMDRGIGRIVAELKQQGQFENTLVMYLQDNGGCAEGMGRQSNAETIREADYKPLGTNGLQTEIWPPMQTRDGRPVRTGPEAMPGPEDTYVAYGRGWANVSNTPFRGYKHDSLEGGISTPFIAHWPAGIPAARRNTLVHHPAHLIDLMPTCVAVAGADYPVTFNGETIQPMEGMNLLPSFRGTPLHRSVPLGFEHHGNAALRDGRWKIVTRYRANRATRWALYDMEADRTELTDLAAERPELLKGMVLQWEAWARRVGVQPWPIEAPQPAESR